MRTYQARVTLAPFAVWARSPHVANWTVFGGGRVFCAKRNTPAAPSPPPIMESSAKKLSSLRITSLDDDDDETEVPHQPPPAGPSAAAADYEDADDEDEEVEVTLGVLSKPKHPGLLLRHLFPSKAGGIPVRAPTRPKFQ